MKLRDIYTRSFHSQDISSPPGRVKTFLTEPHRNTMPHSCVFRKYHNDLNTILDVVAKDLCGGAGVKINLDEFDQFEPINTNWKFYLDENNPDLKYLTEEQKRYLTTEVTYDDYVISVADSMRGYDGIRASWGYFIEELLKGNSVVVDLSHLRPAGTINSKGLMASGAIGKNDPNETSFFSIYKAIADHLADGKIGSLLTLLGTVNDCLRRGGYKRGIICTSLDYRSESIKDYLDFDNNTCPGGHKKAVRIDGGVLDSPYLKEIADSAEGESTFLEKINPDRPDLYHNVCQAIRIPENHICLIWRYNLGMIGYPEDIPYWIESTVRDAVQLHQTWRDRFSKEELSHLPTLEEDKQIAVDPIGMASFLANFGISYYQFTEALKKYNADPDSFSPDNLAEELVKHFAEGFNRGIMVADKLQEEEGLPLLERIFTPAEPSQRHFVDLEDIYGYTVTRSVFPPFERKQRRVSDHEEQLVFSHNPDIEIASDVGGKLTFEFAEQWQTFVDSFGRSHNAISFDSFEEITPEWMQNFVSSNLQSKYYSESSRYNQNFLKKQSGICELGDGSDLDFEESRTDECAVCAE